MTPLTGSVRFSLGFLSFPLIAGSGAGGSIIHVEAVLLDVMDHRDRDQVAHAHLAPQEEPYLGAADVILNELLDHIDVILPLLQGREGLVDVRTAALDDESLDGHQHRNRDHVRGKNAPHICPRCGPNPSHSTRPA